MKYKALSKFCDKLLTFIDKETDWKENNDTTNSQVITEFVNRNEKLLNKLIKSEGEPDSDTDGGLHLADVSNSVCLCQEPRQVAAFEGKFICCNCNKPIAT
jgi:hypothetical protein